MPLSKSQIDRLGDRLKGGIHTESDLRLLDDYRRTFGEAYEVVIQTIRRRGQFPTGRLAKSTASIVEKLRRESIRLSQMQDIAGCRVVVANVAQQDQFVASLKADFPEASVIDRRENPSYGYRAMHIIVEISGKPIEIQVRSSLQHLWAEVSEKASDVLDSTIKYGGGPERWRNFLATCSKTVTSYEELEKIHSRCVAAKQGTDAAHEKFKKAVAQLSEHHVPDHEAQKLREKLEESTREVERLEKEDQEIQGKMAWLLGGITDSLTVAISWLDELKGKKQ